MTLTERCQAGEAKLERVSAALLDPRPEILDRCEAELQEVIGLLEGEPADSSGRPVISERPVASDRNELLRLRHRIRLLAVQVQQAANLCQGWIQLSVSQGYTDQGRPALPASQPQATYEV